MVKILFLDGWKFPVSKYDMAQLLFYDTGSLMLFFESASSRDSVYQERGFLKTDLR